MLLGVDDKKKKNRKKSKRRCGSSDEEMISDDEDGPIIPVKRLEEKNINLENLMKKNFIKMKYMMDCGFNLLVYGVGSKLDLMNMFV